MLKDFLCELDNLLHASHMESSITMNCVLAAEVDMLLELEKSLEHLDSAVLNGQEEG